MIYKKNKIKGNLDKTENFQRQLITLYCIGTSYIITICQFEEGNKATKKEKRQNKTK